MENGKDTEKKENYSTKQNKENDFKLTTYQILLGLACVLVHLGYGTSISFSGLTLLQLTENSIVDTRYINKKIKISTNGTNNFEYNHTTYIENSNQLANNNDLFDFINIDGEKENVNQTNYFIHKENKKTIRVYTDISEETKRNISGQYLEIEKEVYKNKDSKHINTEHVNILTITKNINNNESNNSLYKNIIIEKNVHTSYGHDGSETSMWKISLNEKEMAFFSSAVTLGSACTAPLNGYLLVTYGHKNALMFGLIVYIISWIFIMATPWTWALLAGRLIQGIGVNIVITSTELYILETTHENIRATLYSLLGVARYAGAVFIYGIGTSELNWRFQALICCLIFNLPSIFLVLKLPTSPRYLASIGDIEGAEGALKAFRGSVYDTTDDMKRLGEIFKDKNKNSSEILDQIRFLCQRRVLKFFSILCIVIIGILWNGQSVILSYAGLILKDKFPDVDTLIWSLVIITFRVLGCLTMMVIVKKFSYRKTFFVANMIAIISLIVFGVCLYETENTFFDIPSWVFIVCLCTLMFSASLIAPLALLMMGETLPSNCRSLGYVISDSLYYMSYFANTYTFPFLLQYLTSYGTFWLYAGISLAISWIPLVYVPETRGINLEEIQLKLFGSKNKN